MMIVLPLFERYMQILTIASGKGKQRGWFDYKIMGDHLQIDREKAESFWKTFRHGFCHVGMPNTDLCEVSFSARFGPLPPFEMAPSGGKDVICLDPWKFIQYVMDIYRSDQSLLDELANAPLMTIYSYD